MLTFFEAGGDLYGGFLVNREQLSNWRVRNASAMSRRIMTLLRGSWAIRRQPRADA